MKRRTVTFPKRIWIARLGNQNRRYSEKICTTNKKRTNIWIHPIHLVFGTDFLSQNNLTLLFKPTDKKSEDNLKLINEVASADIIEEDDLPIALTEIKTDFGHDVDKRTYNIVKESYDTLIEKREELELVTLHLAQRQFDIRICSSEVCMDRTVADL